MPSHRRAPHPRSRSIHGLQLAFRRPHFAGRRGNRRSWDEAGVADKIDLRLGPALDSLDALLSDEGENQFDFAFIDADKENYSDYYERCLRLTRPGGIVAIDNVLWNGKVADPEAQDANTAAIHALNSALRNDERIDLSLVSIADGLTLARKL